MKRRTVGPDSWRMDEVKIRLENVQRPPHLLSSCDTWLYKRTKGQTGDAYSNFVVI